MLEARTARTGMALFLFAGIADTSAVVLVSYSSSDRSFEEQAAQMRRFVGIVPDTACHIVSGIRVALGASPRSDNPPVSSSAVHPVGSPPRPARRTRTERT